MHDDHTNLDKIDFLIIYRLNYLLWFSAGSKFSQVTVIFQLMYSDVCVPKQAANTSSHSQVCLSSQVKTQW